MLDKLTLTPPLDLPHQQIETLLKGKFHGHVCTNSRNFNRVDVFFKGEAKKSPTLLAVSSEPRQFMGKSKVELNPSHYSGFSEMKEVLSIFGDTFSMKITRIDLAVDIPFTIESVFRKLLISRKRIRQEFSEGRMLSGVYIGKIPELYCIYDKARQLDIEGPLTRVELRQMKHKVCVKRVSELPDLLTATPFERIKLIEAKKNEDLKTNQMVKASILRESISTFGATGAFKLLNSHHTFIRDFGAVIQGSKDLPNFDEIFQSNMKDFFSEGVNCGI